MGRKKDGGTAAERPSQKLTPTTSKPPKASRASKSSPNAKKVGRGRKLLRWARRFWKLLTLIGGVIVAFTGWFAKGEDIMLKLSEWRLTADTTLAKNIESLRSDKTGAETTLGVIDQTMADRLWEVPSARERLMKFVHDAGQRSSTDDFCRQPPKPQVIRALEVALKRRTVHRWILFGSPVPVPWKHGPYILDNTNLRGTVGFRGLDLRSFQFVKTCLQNADFRHARLDGVDLSGALLDSVTLDSATLRHAHLDGAQLRHGRLIGADLFGAHFSNALADSSNLSNTTVDSALFREASLRNTVFDSAHGVGPSFTKARLVGSILTRVDMRGASFEMARLGCVSFEFAKLDGAEFHLARLPWADLKFARLTNLVSWPQEAGSVSSAFFDSTTIESTLLAQSIALGANGPGTDPVNWHLDQYAEWGPNGACRAMLREP